MNWKGVQIFGIVLLFAKFLFLFVEGVKVVPNEIGPVESLISNKEMSDDLVKNPSELPTLLSSQMPSVSPSCSPSSRPTTIPTQTPSALPTGLPIAVPSSLPTSRPSSKPTSLPSSTPSTVPSKASASPTQIPSPVYTDNPTLFPSVVPSFSPTFVPTCTPSALPSSRPTLTPSANPSYIPTPIPSPVPTCTPSATPSFRPTASPSFRPSTRSPTFKPGSPTPLPTIAPSAEPTAAPTRASIVSFNSSLTLAGLNVSQATDKDKDAITQATATSMGVSVDTVKLKALIQVVTVGRRLSSGSLMAQAILEVIQEVTGGKDPTSLYQQLTDQISKAVQSNNFTAVLQAVAQTLGADSAAAVKVDSIVNSQPLIYIPPAPPTFSPTKAPSDSSSGRGSSDDGLSLGVIIGIVIGGVFGVVLIGFLFNWIKSSRSKLAVTVLPAAPSSENDIDLMVPNLPVHQKPGSESVQLEHQFNIHDDTQAVPRQVFDGTEIYSVKDV